MPAITPMMAEDTGETKAQGAVMATRPPSMPLAIIRDRASWPR